MLVPAEERPVVFWRSTPVKGRGVIVVCGSGEMSGDQPRAGWNVENVANNLELGKTERVEPQDQVSLYWIRSIKGLKNTVSSQQNFEYKNLLFDWIEIFVI